MPIYVIERNFSGKLEKDSDAASSIDLVSERSDVKWLLSLLSVARIKTFCLYEAPNAEALIQVAEQAGLPADAIFEIGEEIISSGRIKPISVDRHIKLQP